LESKVKASKIFRWIWRINGLTFLVCSLIIIGAIIVAFYPTVKDYVRRRPMYRASDMVNIEDNVNLNSNWSLSGFRQITGTNFMMSAVHSKQEYSVGFGSGKEASATRNYLFLNSVDKATRWLVPTNQYLFISDSEIKEDPKNNSKVLALEYRFVKDDTNKDNRLTQDDKLSFAISDLDGSNFTELLGGIDEILSDEQPDPGTILLIYRSDGKNLVTEIKISEKKVLQTKELPPING